MPIARRLSKQITIIISCFVITLLPYSVSATIDQNQREQTYRQLEVFANVLSILQDSYVEEIDTAETIHGAIQGLLHSLDPHSAYLKPEEFKDFQEETQGQFSGIGIEITIQDNTLIVVSPIEGTPADQAGLKANDIILEIDGDKTKEMGAVEAVRRLRGKQGTSVTITVYRAEWEEPRKISLVRDIIPIQSVKAFFIAPGFAYSRITNFQSNTAKDYIKEITLLEKETDIKGLILDLRNNPGGLLSQAVNISDLFLKKGMIVYTQGRTEDQNMTFNAHASKTDLDYPLVILVNEGSASASEIVAGALQSQKRAILVGNRTFGKGSVQTIIPLPGGAGLRMTTAKYFTPDGKSIQALGITPDIEVPQIACNGDSSAAESKINVRESALTNHFPANNNQTEKDSKKNDTPTKEDERLKSDNQLRSALNILKSLNVYSQYNQ